MLIKLSKFAQALSCGLVVFLCLVVNAEARWKVVPSFSGLNEIIHIPQIKLFEKFSSQEVLAEFTESLGVSFWGAREEFYVSPPSLESKKFRSFRRSRSSKNRDELNSNAPKGFRFFGRSFSSLLFNSFLLAFVVFAAIGAKLLKRQKNIGVNSANVRRPDRFQESQSSNAEIDNKIDEAIAAFKREQARNNNGGQVSATKSQTSFGRNRQPSAFGRR
ncbi:MAG: hypothetical protein ABJK39_03550 [Hyphomicrobiales bacterium]